MKHIRVILLYLTTSFMLVLMGCETAPIKVEDQGVGEPAPIAAVNELYLKTNTQRPASESIFVVKPLELDISAASRGNFLAASIAYKEAAARGDPYAQTALALMYKGEIPGLAPDGKKVLQWFHKAAEQGFPEAQFQLGEMYYFGIGVIENKRLAAEWYRKAAEQGHAIAQNNLGSRYLKGEGVSKDHTIAMTWYTKSAYQGNVYGQFNLGGMYTGKYDGVPKNYVRLFMWSELAAVQGIYADARKNANYALRKMSESQKRSAESLKKEVSANINKSAATQLYERFKVLTTDMFTNSTIVSHERLHFNGFTAIPPPDWGKIRMDVIPDGSVDRTDYTFASFENKDPCKQCSAKAMVALVNLDEQRFLTSDKLLEYLKQSEAGAMFFASHVLESYKSHFKYWKDNDKDKVCVRYESINRTPFSLRKTYYKKLFYGYVCIHPLIPSVAVTAGVLSSTLHELNADEKEDFINQANHFLEKIEFTPPK